MSSCMSLATTVSSLSNLLDMTGCFCGCGKVVEALARGVPADGGPAKPLADVRTNTVVSRVEYPAGDNVLVHVAGQVTETCSWAL